MEFWGVEVKPGESLKVQPEFCRLIHISQASLGEAKDVKGAKNVPLRLKIDGKDLVIGSLAAEDRPQILFDLVFEKEFELSHGWKNGSVYFLGYIADDPDSDEDDSSDSSGSEDEDELVPATHNGNAQPKSEEVEAAKSAKAAKKETFVAKPEESGSDEDEDESDSDDEDDEVDSEDDDMESSEEELPQKEQPTKKRPAESPKMTPPGKKAKPNQKGSPFAGKGAEKPQQGGGNKFNKGQKVKAGSQRR